MQADGGRPAEEHDEQLPEQEEHEGHGCNGDEAFRAVVVTPLAIAAPAALSLTAPALLLLLLASAGGRHGVGLSLVL